jgi:hypothetical protein
MSEMVVKVPSINLYDFTTRNRESENLAIYEIQRQILRFLDDNKKRIEFFKHRDSSIPINKIIYFSAKALENINKKLIISRGWYKYGPCYEGGRHSEESLSLMVFPNLEPAKTILPEIEENCKKEISIFLKTKFREYPYDYLTHIYNERVDFPEIKEFYIAKHELSNALFQWLRGEQVSSEKLNKLFINFDKEIANPRYFNLLKISDKDIDVILEYTSILNYIINNSTKIDKKSEFIIHESVNNFINIVLMIFADKNYSYTFHTSNEKYKKIIIEHLNNNYKKCIDIVNDTIKLYYSKIGFI